jgi:hypothetical protein
LNEFVSDVAGAAVPLQPLKLLEENHRLLSQRRRKLHELIDMMERVDSLDSAAAAKLAVYKKTERNVSWDRRVLYRKIGELRAVEEAGSERRAG